MKTNPLRLLPIKVIATLQIHANTENSTSHIRRSMKGSYMLRSAKADLSFSSQLETIDSQRLTWEDINKVRSHILLKSMKSKARRVLCTIPGHTSRYYILPWCYGIVLPYSLSYHYSLAVSGLLLTCSLQLSSPAMARLLPRSEVNFTYSSEIYLTVTTG